MEKKEKEELLREIRENPYIDSYYPYNDDNNEYYYFKFPIINLEKDPSPNTTASTIFNEGYLEFFSKNYRKTVDKFSKAFKLNPKYATSYNYTIVAISYFNLENYEKAINNFTNSINSAYDYNNITAYSYYNRGIIYNDLKKFECAIQDFTKAIELNSNNSQYYNSRGIAYFNNNDYKNAISDFTEAFEKENNTAYYTIAINNRGVAYYYNKNYKEAIEDFSKAISYNNDYVLAFYNRGIIQNNNGNYKEAIEDFTRIINLEPYNASYYNSRGIAYFNNKDYKSAFNNFKNAFELSPSFLQALKNKKFVSSILKKEKIKINNELSINNRNYYLMFNRLNALYIQSNFKKIKKNYLHYLQDFKKEAIKEEKSLEVKKLIREIKLLESIFKDEPKKLEGYLIFADILGWKGIWKKQDKKDIANVTFFIKNILEKEFDKELKEKKYNISLISDTFIVFSKELELSNKISKKLMELCLENGLAIRGAISYGECYNRDTVYVGQAVDEAASWHDEGEEIGIFYTPSAKQEIINNKKIKKSDLLKDFIKLKSGEIETFFIDWYSDKTKKKFYELFDTVDKTSIKVYLKYLNTEEKFEKYGKE